MKLLLALVVCLMIAPAAFAQATVVTEFGCIIVSADWGTGTGPSLFTTDSKAVLSNSGNVNFLCDFDIPPAEGPAVIKKGFLCGAYFDLTTDTMSITDWEYGKVHLSCKVKK